MRFAQRTLIALDLDQKDHVEQLKSLRGLGFLEHSEIHLVYVFRTTSMSLGLGRFPLVFPTPEDQKLIEEAILAGLQHAYNTQLEPKPGQKIITRCLFGEDPKDVALAYVKDHAIDLTVVWAREKRGIFESSFSNHLAKHSRAHTLILKHI